MISYTPQDSYDFRNARMRSFLRSAWGLLSGRSTKLMAWDEVKDKLGLRGLIRRGVQTVPVSQIVGSVGRYRDFDDAFLPKSNELSDRWRKINRAFYQDVSLPPVSLYKVGDVYFVLDGNHRVSVAREHGVEFLDADVVEAVTRVPLTAEDIDADHLERLGEYAEFLERTQLDQLRPEQNIKFTIGGGYDRLIEHIAVHRYYMGMEQQRDIGENEAVMDWYDNVYMPIVETVRNEDILKDFPDRTESDLYVWIIDHRHFLQKENSDDVDFGQAVTDYADKFGEKSPLQRMQAALSGVWQSVVGDDEPTEPLEKAVEPPSLEDAPYV
jgi:hypothetical protein